MTETTTTQTPVSCPPNADDFPLTCTFCRRASATYVLVWDTPDTRRLSGQIRTTALVCGDCVHRNEERARQIAASPASAWLFRLMPDTADTPEPWECPRCHCLFERAGLDHEPCRTSKEASR
jgi:hypothetical protein